MVNYHWMLCWHLRQSCFQCFDGFSGKCTQRHSAILFASKNFAHSRQIESSKLTKMQDTRKPVEIFTNAMPTKEWNHLQLVAVGMRSENAKARTGCREDLKTHKHFSSDTFSSTVVTKNLSYWIVLPIWLKATPGPQTPTPRSLHCFATSTRRRPGSSTSPARKVADVSPWKPL